MILKDMWLKLCSVSLATLLLAHAVATQTSLFSSNEPITQLSVYNFSSVISNSPKFWVVDFYAAWCGYCKRLAPEFSAVARNIQGWSDVVGMAAIACSDPINSPLCRNYHITGYPVIKFFPPNSGSSYRGHKYEGDKLAAGLLIGIVQYLNQLVNEGTVDRSWPKLKSVEHPQELRQSNGTRQVLVVVEDNSMSTKHVGLMVILDSLQMRPDVVVGRMSSRDATRYGVSSSGLFRMTSFGGLQEISRETTREPITRSIVEAAGRGSAVTEAAGAIFVTTAAAPKAYDFTPSNGLHMQDLESSLYYSLWVEIPSRVSFDSESLTALKRYINILAKFHPGDAHVRNFLTALNDWLSIQRPPLSSASWLQKLNSIQSRDAYILESLRWTGCNGSLPSLRGYPCSLWMTFHAITVSAYVREIANMSFDARDVLVPISDYIRVFFSCRECADNFRRRAGDLATRSLEPRDVVLWLWKMHNRANLHLHGDASEDPRHPKVQFPSHRACPSCRVEAAAGLRFNVTDNAWREDRVLTYLLRYYGVDHIVDDDAEETSSAVTRRPHSHGGGSSSGDHVTGSPAASLCPSNGSSDWTPCSQTCDVGISVRMTQSVASGCRLVPEVRLCLTRPCDTQFPNWTRSPWHESNCAKYGHTYRLTKAFAMSYGNCSLTEAESWRVCGLCPPSRNRPICCRPVRSVTQSREVACMVRSERGQVHRVVGSTHVEVIDYCKCDQDCN